MLTVEVLQEFSRCENLNAQMSSVFQRYLALANQVLSWNFLPPNYILFNVLFHFNRERVCGLEKASCGRTMRFHRFCSHFVDKDILFVNCSVCVLPSVIIIPSTNGLKLS